MKAGRDNMSRLDINVGFRIRGLRESMRYSREEFAERAGLSSNFLYEIESGKKDFSADTLKKICCALNTSSDYLLFGTNPQIEQINSLLIRLDENQIKLLTGFVIVMIESKPDGKIKT